MMLIDNALYSYYFSMSQGIPIFPFTTDRQDVELPKLTSFLMACPADMDLSLYCNSHFKHLEISKKVRNVMDYYNLYSPEQRVDE